jgi:hypothetical protein
VHAAYADPTVNVAAEAQHAADRVSAIAVAAASLVVR